MQATSCPNTGRGAVIAGVVLMIVGGASLMSQLLPDYDRYLPLLVGLGLWAVFVFTSNYLVLVGAGILTGLGAGLLAAEAFPTSQADGAGAVLGLGIGFISIWIVGRLLALPHHHFWPLIPGTILSIIGVGLAVDAFSRTVGELLVPSVVVVLGVLFVIGGLVVARRAPANPS